MEYDLLDLARIVWRRRWMIAILVVAAAVTSYVASKLSAKVYEARSKILILDKSAASLSLLSEISGMPKNQVSNYVEILKSRSLLLMVADRLHQPYDSLKDLDLTVQPTQGTDTIEIRVRDTDRLMAQRWVNTIVECFIARNLRDNQEDARLAREFIEEQLAVVTERLTRAEVALAGYQKDARIVSPTDEVRQAVDKLAQFEADRAALEVDLVQTRARLDGIEQQLSTEEQTLVSAKVLARNPVFERYREQLSALNAELAGALAQYTDKHPTVVALKAQIAKLQEDLDREMETIVQSQTETLNPLHQAQLQQALSLQAQILAQQAGRQALDREIGRLEGKLTSLPSKEMQLARLMREKASAEAIYTLLVTKKSEMEITEHMRTASVRLVDPAYRPREDEPVKPNTKLNVAVAVFLGLFVGVGLVFLLEYLDPSIKSRDEAVALLGLPVFGMIPDNEVFHENGGAKYRLRWPKTRPARRTRRPGL